MAASATVKAHDLQPAQQLDENTPASSGQRYLTSPGKQHELSQKMV
jgi:hypothetical protein